MYAVIETGGKQYRVEVGTELAVDLLDAEPGKTITFDRVLLVGDGDATAVGRPTVADAAVEAEVVRRGRGEKLVVFKYRPKARTRVKKGHRQDHLVLRITDVKVNGRSAAEESRKAQDEARTERQRLEEAAARQAAADAELAAKLAKRNESLEESAPKARRSTRARTSDATDAKDATAGDINAEPAADADKEAKPASRRRSTAASADDSKGSADDTNNDDTKDEPARKRGAEGKDG